MTDTDGQTASPIIDDLLAHGHEFNFTQVMRLSRQLLGAGGIGNLPDIDWQDRVRVRPELSLAFPPADVSKIEQFFDCILVTVTFLAFYGSSSPLPTFYTEDLFDEASNDSSVSRDFLDILHQRLYQLYFQCWSKYRLFIRVAEEKCHLNRERLFCLIGLGQKALRDSVPEAWSLVRYAGLLSQFPRSALGLQIMLRDALGISLIIVEQCVLRKVATPPDQRMSLGRTGMRLGVDTVLGSEIKDRMGKFRILIGPLKKKKFDDFLPGAPLHDKLARLIRAYILDPFDYDMKLTLAANEAKPIRLGHPDARVGLGTFCFSGETLGEVSIIIPIAQPSERNPSPEEVTRETGSANLTEYYQEELATLRELTARFVEQHPDMAPLVSGHKADPGVERVTEGVAFLNAHLRQKLDDDFPEVIHEVTEALHPWNLRPIPATTIVAFLPKRELKQPMLIPAGAEVASIPVHGTRCRFQTCFDVTVHPLTLLSASFLQPSGRAPSIILQCELDGIGLSSWNAKSLRFFLGDDYSAACDLCLLLTRYLMRVTITSPDNGATMELPPNCLQPAGFADDETILSQEKSFMPGHLILQEYFLFPDKFLFMDLTGLDKCRNLGGSRFEINFELASCPLVVPQINEKSFVFSATPVINLFPHRAKPISYINALKQHAIRPAGVPFSQYQLYSVDRVEGLVKKKSIKIKYEIQKPLLRHSKDASSCHITRCKSSLGEGFDTFLSIPPHNNGTQADRIKLDIDLTCTNGTLPEKLKIGDICTTTATTPESVEPCIIKDITAAVFQETRQNQQWKLLSGFSLNSVSLNGVDNFRAILRLFVNSNSRNQLAVMANFKKIDAIESIEAKPADRLIGRGMYRGYDIYLKLSGDHFAGPGDLYLFCSVLERLLGEYVTQNCFIRLVVEEVDKGYRFEWATRMGDRCAV